MKKQQAIWKTLVYLLLCSSISFLSDEAFAQDETATDEQLVLVANEMYNFGDVKDAMEVYVQAIEVNPQNVEANFMAGRCYLTTINKDLALKYLLKAYELNPNIAYNILLYIGTAYHLNYDFDKAISYYEQYRTRIISDFDGVPLNDTERTDEENKIERKIYECNNGKEYIKTPVDIELFNLGEGVNSEYKDYGPILNADLTQIFFTSRRKGSTGANKDNDNEFYEDLYTSQSESDQWQASVNMGIPINSNLHESCIGISPDGKELYMYVDNEKNIGDIFYTTKDSKGSWSNPKKLGKTINTEFIENSMTLSKDGKTMFFSSNRPGGFGGQDLYVSKKDPKGEWGEPENLGSYVNTEHDDEGPFLDFNGTTLFFSSKGHQGMGGFDLYRTLYDSTSKKWSKPENLLYPINSTDDDMYFVLSQDGVYGYFSSNKNIGYGDADIYRIRMPKEYFKSGILKKELTFQPSLVVKDTSSNLTPYNIKLNITDKVSGNQLEATVEITDMSTDKELEQSLSAGGHFDETLSFSKNTTLLVSVKKDGYLFQDITIKINADGTGQKSVQRSIELEKPIVGNKYVLKNIYYDFDKTDLKKESEPELRNLLKLMQSTTTMRIEVGSHTDDLGEKEYNYNLSQRRAQSVINWLSAHGVNKSRIEAKGYGEDEPIASNDDEEEGRALNRRTEIKILSK
jgi:outer membrane protein OmpA-like peptidoglycan-associated protein/tetratricopeptide (TPR) repeat protein